ncbi:ExbD/TolR family protein [Pedobacter flavus]|uniref:Biopolymer transporter ExbD n=1 Tax=Pedobacter flavus TaxID=3113906 RepID=A0ABU7H0L7_9SPHI|nr:biopolymer transporter ExbD [Pedobacter sp. VNH31]MEE1884627.1 biopolymer transporter ExbD [Pedobacter sp. VNH31]
MAELDTSGGGKKSKKVRSKKQSTRVDLTAMVDLAFLLITFFMLTTSLSKPIAMDVVKPDKNKEDPTVTFDFPESRTMTILIGKDHKVAWYMGLIGSKPTIESITQVRASLIEWKNKVAAANNNNPDKPLIVIVKPTKSSQYMDFVNVMDELKIAGIETIAIDDDNIKAPEIQMMKDSGVY